MENKEIEKLADDYATSVYGYSNENHKEYEDCKRHCIDFFVYVGKHMEKYNERVICKDCNYPISQNDIDNHLFMKIEGGGLIHWNCNTCE